MVVDPAEDRDAIEILSESMHRRWIDEPVHAHLVDPGADLEAVGDLLAGIDL